MYLKKIVVKLQCFLTLKINWIMATKRSKPLNSKAKEGGSPKRASPAPLVQQAAIPFGKKRSIIISYNNISPEVRELLLEKYPAGWRDHVIKINKGSHDFFYAITLDTPDVDYLIKVDVEIDSRQKLEEDRSIFGTYDEGEDEDNEELPSKEDEKIADDSPDAD